MKDGFVKPEDTEPGTEGFEFYFDAFQELSTSRPVGMGVGPIPFTAIAEYFRIYELSDFQDFEDFVYLIRRMDNVFLEVNAAAEATEKPEGGKKSGTNPNKKHPNKNRHTRR